MAGRYAKLRSDIGHFGFGSPLATINRELRQAQKGATVAIDSGAGVQLVRVPPNSPNLRMRVRWHAVRMPVPLIIDDSV